MTVVVLLLFSAWVYAAGPGPELAQIGVEPQTIEVKAFYGGAEVKVTGKIQSGSNVLATVVGSDREEQFNRKGRFGPIWLNQGKVRVTGVPSLFLRFSSAPVNQILGRQEISLHGLDKTSLMERMHTEPVSATQEAEAKIRADYLSLRESDGAYNFGQGGIQLEDVGQGEARFTLAFHWPQKAPPDRYEIRVREIRDGAVVRQSIVPIRVVRSGFPAWIAAMASTRAAMYGFAAVLIAVMAGFGIDFLTTKVFGGKRSAAH